jgi:hypothetical protein
MAPSIVPIETDLATKAFMDLKTDLDEEKATQLTAQIGVNVLSRVVRDLKIPANRFAT